MPTTSLVGPFISILRHPVLAVLPTLILLCLLVGTAVGTTEVYRAEAQVLVGRVDVESTAIPGFVSANQQLAGLYSRIAETSVIAAPVSEKIGISADDVLDRSSASPVPESSILRIEAVGGSPDDALTLAEALRTQLLAYVQNNSVRPAGVQESLREFENVSRELLAAQETLQAESQVLTSLRARLGPESRDAPVLAQITKVQQAQAAVNTRQLQVNALGGTFQDTQRGSAQRNSLQAIGQPRYLGTDRRSTIQMAVAVSVLVGALLGVAWAMGRSNRGALRRVRQTSLGLSS